MTEPKYKVGDRVTGTGWAEGRATVVNSKSFIEGGELYWEYTVRGENGIVAVVNESDLAPIKDKEEPNWCRTSQQWVEELYPNGSPVVDPDGWDRKDFEYSWHQEPISREEFEKRLMNSTLRMPPVLVEPKEDTTPQPDQFRKVTNKVKEDTTEPTQIAESLRDMYELGVKHGRALEQKDQQIKQLTEDLGL